MKLAILLVCSLFLVGCAIKPKTVIVKQVTRCPVTLPELDCPEWPGGKPNNLPDLLDAFYIDGFRSYICYKESYEIVVKLHEECPR